MTDSVADGLPGSLAGKCRRGPAWPLVTRATTAIIALPVLAMLAACAASPPASGHGSSARSPASYIGAAVRYAHCVRAHGVPEYPDPDSAGVLPKGDAQQFGVSAARYQAAQQACRTLLPAGGSVALQEHQCMQDSDCPPALVQQMMSADLKLARCMRSHGFPNFPDPTNDGASGPIFNITKAGISDAASHAPRFIAKLTECGRLVGLDAPQSFE